MFSIEIFLKLSGLASLVVDVSVMVGVCVPKTIPHFLFAPMVHMHTFMLYLKLICT